MYVLSAREDVDARLIDYNTTLLPLTATSYRYIPDLLLSL